MITFGGNDAVHESGGVVQYVIHPALRPALDEWLASRGLMTQPSPFVDEDELPTFFVQPTEETMRASRYASETDSGRDPSA